jgi:hypothetical protein
MLNRKEWAAFAMMIAFFMFLTLPLELVMRGRYISAGISTALLLASAWCFYEHTVTP